MFAAVILICGLNIPTAVNGCSLVYARTPFTSLSACQESVTNQSKVILLPDGAYVNHYTCVSIGRMQ